MPTPRVRYQDVWVAACLLVLAYPDALAAQAAVIRGSVLDHATDRPVAGAEVRALSNSDARGPAAIAGPDGTFQLQNLAAAEYRLTAKALGFLQTTTPGVQLGAADTIHIIIRLGARAVPLAPLEVTARSSAVPRNIGIAEFHRRAERRMGGWYVLPQQITERKPSQTLDLFMEMPSVDVSHTSRTLTNSRTRCSPHVWVDGQRVTGAGVASGRNVYEALNVINPVEVHGIEVYTGISTVPAQFSGTGAGCGIIAIWLKR